MPDLDKERIPPQKTERKRTRMRLERILAAVPTTEQGALAPSSGDTEELTRDKFDGAVTAILSDSLSRREFDIRIYGADPTGVSNSRNALQAAINAAGAAGGGRVLVANGTYRITAPYIEFLPGVDLECRGASLTYTLPDAYDRDADFAVGFGTTRSSTIEERWLDSSGSYHDTFTTTPYPFPWNGKGSIFVNVEDSVWTNVEVDAGWGTTLFGISSLAGGSASDEFTYYQVVTRPSGAAFLRCNFLNSPGAVINAPSSTLLLGCSFSEYGDHVVYARTVDSATGAKDIRVIGCVVTGTRAVVGTPGTYPYTVSPPSSNYVGPTTREAFKLQTAQDVVLVGNTVNTPDACFAVLEAAPRLDNATSDGWLDTSGVVISGNQFYGHRFLFLLASRRIGAAITSVPGNTAGLIIRDVKVSGNRVILRAATRWAGGTGKFIAARETPTYGEDYGFTCANVEVSDNHVSGSWTANLLGNPEYVSGADIDFRSNVFITDSSLGCFRLGGRISNLTFAHNRFEHTDPNNTGSTSPIRTGFDTRKSYLSGLRLLNNEAFNFGFWIFENCGSSSAEFSNGTSYGYGTAVFDDHTLTLSSLVRAASGALYENTTSVSPGGGDPATNPSAWAAYARPTTTVRMVGNVKTFTSSAGGLTAADRCGYLTYFYSPTGVEQMKWIARIIHGMNVNLGQTGETAAYSLSTPAGYSSSVLGDVPLGDIPSPLSPMGYVNATSHRIALGYNYDTPATTVDIRANELLFGADNGSSETRSSNTIKAGRLTAPSYSATSASAGTRIGVLEALMASSYSSVVIGSTSGNQYAPTEFSVWTATNTATAGSSASQSLSVGGSSRVGIGCAYTAHPSAALAVESTSRGLLPPRLSTAQRNAISSPEDGLIIYNTTTSKLQVRAGGAWVDLH